MSNNKALTDQQKRARDKLYTLYKRDGLPDDIAYAKATRDIRQITVNYWERVLKWVVKFFLKRS